MIRPRKVFPRPTATASQSAFGTTSEKTGRNPALQGLRLDVYQFVEANPDCTRSEVARGLKLAGTTATARIKELIDEGLLYEPPGETKLNSSGVKARVLRVAPENYVGDLRDRVQIELDILVDITGNYYADCKVVGGHHMNDTADLKLKILTKRITVMVPKAREVQQSITSDKVTKVRKADVSNAKNLIIDAEYFTVEGDDHA